MTEPDSTQKDDLTQTLPSYADEKIERKRKYEEDFDLDEEITFAASAPDYPFARTPTAESKWTDVKSKLAEISVQLGLDTPDRPFFRRIEHGFSFRASPHDTDFYYLHVEPLLDQAADLLERAIKERGHWDELAAKAAQLSLEMSEYQLLDAIHREEEAAGVYLLEAKTTTADLVADTSFIKSMDTAASQQGTVESHIDDPTQKRVSLDAVQKAAWVGGIWNYYFGSPGNVTYANPGFYGVSKSVADHSYDAAGEQWQYEHKIASFSAGAQKHAFLASQASVSSRIEAVRFRDEWNKRNIEFRKRRTIAARNIQDLKAKLVTDSDGILNHAKRLPAIKKRFQADFNNALARMIVAQDGIEKLFGYTTKIPTNMTSIDYFDDCLVWCRDAIHWIIRFARREQGTVRTVSLRSLLGNGWANFIANHTAMVTVPASEFAGLSCVRIRGVALNVVQTAAPSGTRPALWKIRCRVPQSGRYVQLNGSVIDIDQASAPPCQFGRVSVRNFVRDPDVLGASALHNTSPIGNWEFTVDGAVGQPFDLTEIEDIELDIHIVYRLSEVS
jgi:hypothetical protein